MKDSFIFVVIFFLFWFLVIVSGGKSDLITDLERSIDLTSRGSYAKKASMLFDPLAMSRMRIYANIYGAYDDPLKTGNKVLIEPTININDHQNIFVNVSEIERRCLLLSSDVSCFDHFTVVEVATFQADSTDLFRRAEQLYFEVLGELSVKKKDHSHSNKKIVKKMICALIIYETIFNSIEKIISDYITEYLPGFTYENYDPYVDPYPDMNYGYAISNDKKRSNIQDSSYEKNCTRKGLYPIWNNINCYQIKTLGNKNILRMMFEESILPDKGCIDNCKKELLQTNDYDLNDFVADFNYIHVYISFRKDEERSLMGVYTDLIPKMKGTSTLSEIRLSFDYLTDNFDELTCKNLNWNHENQNARQFFKGKCKGGEITGGNWNEFSRIHMAKFHTKNKKISKIKTEESVGDSQDINLSPIKWKYCNKKSGCSKELVTNDSEKHKKKAKKIGGPKIFLNNGTISLFKSKKHSNSSQTRRKFTTFAFMRGDCKTDTEMTTPMYYLRSYKNEYSHCCSINSCKDNILIDIFDKTGKIPFNLKNQKPVSLVVDPSQSFGKLQKEGINYFTYNEESFHGNKKILQNTVPMFCHNLVDGDNNTKIWSSTDNICMCDNDCHKKDNTYETIEQLMHQRSSNLRSIGKTKCMPPLGMCSDNKTPCSEYDTCVLLGAEYYCDQSFLDSQGEGFSFCRSDSRNITTDVPCKPPKQQYCGEGVCFPLSVNCHPEMPTYLENCKNLELITQGKSLCQFNFFDFENDQTQSWTSNLSGYADITHDSNHVSYMDIQNICYSNQ